MNKTKEDILKALDAPIPRSAVSSRQGGGTKALSYLEGWYVIDLLNKIFGPDAWSYDVTELRNVHSGELDGKYGKIYAASYSATVALFVMFPDSPQAKRITDVGFGNGTDKADPGKPHELATKEAVTDALKRCAKSLGMSLGLALYDKSQEHVEEERPAAKAPAPAPKQTVAPQSTPSNDREALNKKITAMSKVVLAKKLKTLDELKADMKSRYGVDNTAALNDEQASTLFNTLETLANG